jgi:uncharacterized membrane protein
MNGKQISRVHMRKLVGLLAVVLLTTAAASAQHEFELDVFGGYSYLHVSPGNLLPGANTNG